MQSLNWIIGLIFICLTFAGCPTSAASLLDVVQGDLSKPTTSLPSKAAILEAFLNHLFHIYPSSNTMSSMKWGGQLGDPNEFFAPLPGKRNVPTYDDDEENEDSRIKRDASHPQINNADDLDSKSWWWSKAAVRRSPFSPRLGKRDELHYGLMYDDDDDDTTDMDNLRDDESDDNLFEDATSQDYTDEAVSPQRLALRSALVPRLGKKAIAFSPRLGKRGTAFIPRLGKRGDFAFSPRLGKRGDFAFSPRLGKKADFAFSPRLGKRGDFAFSPRLGKKSDFAFSPRLGKRGDFAFSPRLGKKSDFAFSPRLGKRGNAFIPRLGKRDAVASSSEDTWSNNSNDVTQLQQRSVAFSPRLG